MPEDNSSTSVSNSPIGKTNYVAFSLIIFAALTAIILVFVLVKYQPFANEKTPTSKEPVRVTITKDGFKPETVKIRKGNQVTWFNQDTEAHQVASDPHPIHNSLVELGSGEVLGENESLTFTFEKTGTFTVHDHFNPLKIKGKVIVE